MKISAAILAGGRATRFAGADKALLVVGGTPIIERQLAALAAITDDVRIVANDAERYAGLGVRVVADAVSGAGPLGGLYTALLDAHHDRVLVLACDLPFVTAALLERLARESVAAEGIDAVVPRSSKGLEPLCAVYDTACAARVKARLERGDLAITALFADLRVREIGHEVLAPFDEGTLFENVNTPHDYARARALVENEKPSEDRITE